MNLPAIFIANGTAIVLLIILLLSSQRNVRYGLLDDNIFHVMVVFTILQCFIESASFYIDGKTVGGYRELSLVLNCLLYINNILFAYLWTVYADYKLFTDMNRIKKIYPFIGIPAMLITLGSIVNLFTPVFYQVSEENVYVRTSLYVIPYVFTYLYLAYGVMLIYFYRKKIRKYLFLPAIIFMIPILLGSLLQFFFYGLSLVWIGVAVALVSLYVNVQNEATCVDNLSGLFNRQYMNHYLYAQSKRSGTAKMLVGIMLDIDQFKYINDAFGHLVGDDAIRSAGRILRESAPPECLVARYAGDEFVILTFKNEKKDIFAMMEKVRKNTENFNAAKKKPYTLQFSMGYSIYQWQNDSVDSFLGRMDSAMYDEKKEKAIEANHRSHTRRVSRDMS